MIFSSPLLLPSTHRLGVIQLFGGRRKYCRPWLTRSGEVLERACTMQLRAEAPRPFRAEPEFVVLSIEFRHPVQHNNSSMQGLGAVSRVRLPGQASGGKGRSINDLVVYIGVALNHADQLQGGFADKLRTSKFVDLIRSNAFSPHGRQRRKS